MAVTTTCSTPKSQYSALLKSLGIRLDEEAVVAPILAELDGLDGTCDGKVASVNYDQLKLAAEKVTALNLSPQRRVEIRNALISNLSSDEFATFIARPYHENLKFLAHNPFFIETLLPHLQPKGLWSDELSALVKTIQDVPPEMPVAYSQLIDQLYERSGLAPLNELLDKAERTRVHETSSQNNDLAAIVGKPGVARSESTTKLMGMLYLPTLPDLTRVESAFLPALRTQKGSAETAFISTLLDKIEILPEAMKKDPMTYWMPLVKLATSEPESAEASSAHYASMQSLYAKAHELATDDVMRILFDVEFAEFTGEPMTVAQLDHKIEEVRKQITAVNQVQYTLPNGDIETATERQSRYYSVIGHLLTRQYGVAISAFEPDMKKVAQIEAAVDVLLQERRDKTSVDEALVYADTVNIIASVWAAEGGLMTQKVMTGGLPAAREELTRLFTLQKRFETLCNGHFLNPTGGEALRNKMADFRWKVLGEVYFRAGMPLQGLTNLENEPLKFESTPSYKEHITDLAKQYPWLVNADHKIQFSHAGVHGEKAEEQTKALFYYSRDHGREALLPLAGAALGSLGGPLGSIAGGYTGKAVNRFINASSDDAQIVLSQARLTGMPLISESLSDQLSQAENIDLITCGVSSFMMFRFYRSALSLSRAATRASYQYVVSGGLRASARASALQLANFNLNAASRALAGRAVSSVQNFPAAVRALPGLITEAHGTHGPLSTINYMWNNYGVQIRLATSAGLMGSDYLPDHKFNTWAGPLGASLLINDIYGKYVWGWNPNGGMVGFAWRYGIVLGAQWMQGIPINKPRMDYTVMGMLASYTIRGVNKLYTLGRAETHCSPLIQKLTHFVEKWDAEVPRSVVGLSNIKVADGMVRGLVMRIGKPAIRLSADLPDGQILWVRETEKSAAKYVIEVARKMTGPSGRAITAVEQIAAPRATAWGRWWSRTVYEKLSDAWVYRIPNAVMKVVRAQPEWWVRLGERVSTPTRPIFNFRGSLANSGDLPILALVGSGFGILQDSDPKMAGIYSASDYGISFFFQHKFQHLMKIDSPLGTFVGYALGVPFSVFLLPTVFPTVVNQTPGLTKDKVGYFDRLVAGDDEGAAKAMQSSVTSLCLLPKVPVVGNSVWNKVTPFGSVEDSFYRIEEVGAVSYWHKMLKKLNESDVDATAHRVMEHFIDKVAHDSEKYLVKDDLPQDPVRLRLLALELAFVKRLMHDKTHRGLMHYAATHSILKEVTEHVPTIRTDTDLRQMITGLNINETVGTFSSN